MIRLPGVVTSPKMMQKPDVGKIYRLHKALLPAGHKLELSIIRNISRDSSSRLAWDEEPRDCGTAQRESRADQGDHAEAEEERVGN
jgi:hypothetical protein